MSQPTLTQIKGIKTTNAGEVCISAVMSIVFLSLNNKEIQRNILLKSVSATSSQECSFSKHVPFFRATEYNHMNSFLD